MKKIKLILMLMIVGGMFFSCEDDGPKFDSANGVPFAQFNGLANQVVVINPSAPTENVFQVGVSTLTSSARSVVVEIDAAATTLDPSFYDVNLDGLTIPAGEFTTDITITTPATDVFPGGSDVLVLNLISVDGVDSLYESSVTTLTLGTTVECPSVDVAALAGTYDVVSHRFDGFFAGAVATREVTVDAANNQITIVGGAVIQDGGEDMILNIDPNSGSVSFGGEPGTVHFAGFGGGTYDNVGGSVLTCIGLIDITIQSDGFIDNFMTLRIQ